MPPFTQNLVNTTAIVALDLKLNAQIRVRSRVTRLIKVEIVVLLASPFIDVQVC
jgi:hypothetical protein